MNGLFPLFLLFLFWIFRAAAARDKTQKKSGQTRKESLAKATGPRSAGPLSGDGPAAAQEKPGMNARYRREFPHLEDSSPVDGDPHLSSSRRSGSLEAAYPEGKDPCHDDPAAMPVGSLRAESPEGEDPGHDHGGNLAAAGETRQEEEPEAENDGLRLDWTGNEIVRGFVYSEILKRKVSQGSAD